MPANISVVNGKAEAMYANKPAWHGLGQVLYENSTVAPNSEESILASGLGWTVEKQAVYLQNGLIVPDKWATVRTDTGMPLGIVGNRYTVQQNVECFNFLDSLIQDGIMRYESAMALDGGRKIALLARMPEYDEIADGDDSLRYILFSTTHDGTGSINVMPTAVRVVCANTLAIAMSRGRSSGNIRSIRHTASKNARLKMAAEWISQFSTEFTLYADKAKKLAETRYTKEQCEAYIQNLFPISREMSSRQLTNVQTRIMKVRDAFVHPSNKLPSINGSWWRLYNSVTYMIDHSTDYRVRGYRNSQEKNRMIQERRFEDLIGGKGSKFKNDAFNLAVEMAL